MFFSLGVPCILPVYFGLRPFAPFQYILLIKKKKIFHVLESHLLCESLSPFVRGSISF
jgi:hypothetical protein